MAKHAYMARLRWPGLMLANVDTAPEGVTLFSGLDRDGRTVVTVLTWEEAEALAERLREVVSTTKGAACD